MKKRKHANPTRASMQANRSTGTKPEIALRKALWAAGLRGYRANYKKLPGKPDICYVGKRVCVFVHGCFWHRCPKCDEKRNLRPTENGAYWEKKIAANVARDREVKALLEQAGWRVTTAWECEIKRDLGAIVELVRQSFV